MDAPHSTSDAPSSTSLSLLERVRANDGDAWRHLVHIYGPVVFHWSARAGLRSEDAADILQEVFQAVAMQIKSFRRDRPGDTFRGWLWAIARHKIADHFRSTGQQAQAVGGSDALQQMLALAEPPAADPSASSENLAQHALELIRTDFEERTWQAFWRVTIEDRLPKDVAVELGMTVDAIRMAKSRVLRRLREELADLDEP
jgi:RNA polymerase sigma-70 factor (ECF subfamily)